MSARQTPLSDLDRARRATCVAAARAGVDVDDPALGLRILEQAVADTVGSGAQPRPGQVALAEDIIKTLRTNPGAELGVDGGRRIAVAATGVGKSFAQLAPAAAAALAGQRTVISTESLSLQAQLLEKDGPVIQRACETITGVRPTIAVHKGWANFACTRSALDAAYDLVGEPTEEERKKLRGRPALAVSQARLKLAALAATLPPLPTKPASGLDTGALFGKPSPATQHEEVALVDWALEQAEQMALAPFTAQQDPVSPGDVNRYPRDIPRGGWAKVSVSSTDCLGDDCPLVDLCLPRAAKNKVAAADIVITNHTLLGIQAAKNVPVVTGSRTLGTFHHLMVDECHALPGTVRAQGASEISGKAVENLRSYIARTLSGLEGTAGVRRPAAHRPGRRRHVVIGPSPTWCPRPPAARSPR